MEELEVLKCLMYTARFVYEELHKDCHTSSHNNCMNNLSEGMGR